MKNITYFVLVTFLVSFNYAELASAKEFSHKDVEQLAKNAVTELMESQLDSNYKISISVHELDPRITINSCNIPLTTNILENQNSRNINVKISCEENNTWYLFVPVKVQQLAPVLIAAINLQKGSIVDASNTEIEFIDQYRIRGEVLSEVTPILGAKLSRNIQRGAPIYRQHVCLVCKGEQVVIMAKSASFQIKTQGLALSDGSIGEQVRVKNSRSGKIISAKVVTINKVIVNL